MYLTFSRLLIVLMKKKSCIELKQVLIDFTTLYKLTSENSIAKSEMREKFTSSGFVMPQIKFKTKMVLLRTYEIIIHSNTA